MEFISREKIPVYRFEKACGISKGYIRSVNKTPGADKISKILSAYPNLNPNWLITGEGSMLIDVDGNEKGIGNITGNKISGVNNFIAMGLSHETGKANTNHFYINNDYRKLDRANRMVIDYVEGKIELD